MVERLPQELLGGHVAQLALDLSLTRDLHAAARLGDAEVDEVRVAVGSDQNVVGRHVAVDDPKRVAALVVRLVRGMEAVQERRP